MNSSTTRWFDEESSVLAALRDARDGDAAAGAGAPEFPGFRVIGEIGRGGQGVVLAARQLATRRLVAIKVLAEGAMAGAERLRRFEREMEIIATLDHPGIVRIFGGGADPQPHIVMEQVDGVPFGRFAEAVDRDPRRLAAAIAEVCDALDVAHRKGVIHRDVKPSNVLVASDERPRIVDFGLARSAAVGRQATATGSGQFLGSIPWASPEHASGDPSRIETRSDIYSVGVLLFEALTGTFPYPVDGSLALTLHGIECADPARPSAMRRDVPRELDAIVLMALAKRPDDRYRSAGDMARDLRAFLSGEPLLARREGATAAMTRLVRRYRAVAIVSGIAAMALLALAVIALRQSAEAQSQRERAERRFGQVRQIVGRLLFDVHASIAGLEGARASRELIVTSALSYLRDLAPDAGDDAAFLAELATAWERVGDIQGNPLVPNLGQTEPAMASYREAIALRERIVSLAGSADADLVALARAQASLGVVELYGGRADAALLTLRSAVATVDRTVGEASSASDVVETRVRLLDGLSDVLALLGRGEEALEALRQAERLLDAASATVGGSEGLETKRGVVEGKLATTLWELGRPKDALGHSEKAVGLLRATAERGGGAAERRALSIELNTLALIRAELGDLARAEDALGESLAIRRRATEIDPSDAQASADLAHVLLRIGGVRARRGDADGMRAATDEAIALRTMLRERSPKDGSLRRGEAIAHAMRAEMHETLAALDGASAAQREAARRSAIEGYERAASLLDAMAAEGLLLPSDAGLPARMRSAAEAVRSKRGP